MTRSGESLRRWAGRLRAELYARLFAACVVGYAFSPVDLIPDPIPVLGYLDDLVLIPIGIAFSIRMIPDHVLAESREEAREAIKERPTSWVAVVVIVALWLSLAALAIFFTRRVI